MQHFKNVYKIYHKQNFNCLVFFKLDRPVCKHLDVNFIKTTLKTIFSLKKSIFAFLTQKNFEVKENCSKTLLNVCQLTYTYIGKKKLNFISVWSEVMSLKSDQLELGFSIFRQIQFDTDAPLSGKNCVQFNDNQKSITADFC